MSECVRILAADPGVGAIALVMHPERSGGSDSLIRLVRGPCRPGRGARPRLVVVSSIPEGVSGLWRDQAASGDVPFLNDLASLKALRALGEAPPPTRPLMVKPLSRPPQVIRRALSRGDAFLSEADCRVLVEAAGIATVPGAFASSAEDAVAAAGRLGYPVAVKLAARAVVHKTELGGVRLNLSTPAEVAGAFRQIAAEAPRQNPASWSTASWSSGWPGTAWSSWWASAGIRSMGPW